jgi:hypothetical protein
VKQQQSLDLKPESAPRVSTPNARAPRPPLLALQRTVGNRAVASLVKPHLRPGKGSRGIMRKRDLEAQYKDRVATDTKKEYYRGYLDDFKKIQDLLYDVPKVRGYLQALSTPDARENVDARLSKEEGAWAASKPILLANTSAFTTVLNKGQMFVDTVAPSHGVHAHRLQWYVIGQDIAKGGYNHSAVDLFREASRVWWREYNDPTTATPVTNGLYMWAQILDTFGGTAFTTPDNLTKFIVDAADKSDFADLANLAEGVKAAETSRRDLRNAHIRRYAASEHFTKLLEWAEGNRQESVPVKRDDKVVVDDWTYTGFIAHAWMTPPSDIEQPDDDQPVPTIVYPPKHDPEGRPAKV